MQLQNSKQSGSLAGGILLVAGCCIGAGMLGLPVLSALGGFIPSVFMFFISWVFMLSTGLLLLEVNLWFKDEVSLISMADRTLGFTGKLIAWSGFLFLFYALMVAYIAGTGELIADFSQQWRGIEMPSWMGSLLTCLFFGVMVYLGTKAVDWLNRIFMVGLIAAYTLLVYFGSRYVHLDYLKHQEWSATFLVVPAMIISFGFHNMVPTLTSYLKGDAKRLRWTIIIGSVIPLFIYIIWEAIILGLVPVEGEGGFRQALQQGDMATKTLRNAIGLSWIVEIANYFAFFAIVTSFLGVALSFVDFLADGLKIKKDPQGKGLLCFLVIALPLAFALIYPKIFLLALSYAGSFGAISLFGILPAAMVWVGRYHKKIQALRLLPGGKVPLVIIFIGAIAVIGLQIYHDILTRMSS
jgi:tyrosine-specific transport protein